jgi:hypothetical protein
MVPPQKVPSPSILKLTKTTITLDNVLFRLTPFKLKKLPMQLESMLDKQGIAFFLIRYVVVNFF